MLIGSIRSKIDDRNLTSCGGDESSKALANVVTTRDFYRPLHDENRNIFID